MKHAGKARQAALKLVFWSLAGLMVIFVAGIMAVMLGHVIWELSVALIAVWVVFALFTFYFFRDPEAKVPSGPGLVVSPGHGKVDIVDKVNEPQFMGGLCQRISIFLSVIDVHVQNAPIEGRVAFYKYTTGQFMSALKTESAEHNENLLFGFEATGGGSVKIGLRLIAGVLARRIVPFVKEGDVSARGERISLIQFGSRTDLYLPLTATIKIKPGDRVVGGETIMATLA
jgi:phosphatidylserine decarboxylase